MNANFNEIDKALKLLTKNGYMSNYGIQREIADITSWQKNAFSVIKSLGRAACKIEELYPHDLLSRECHERKVLYKDMLRKKMKRHKVLRLAVDLYAWARQSGDAMHGRWLDDGTKFYTKLELRDKIDAPEHNGQIFILSTPYISYGNTPICFVGNRFTDWMKEAVASGTGYELHKCEHVIKE